MSAPIKEKQLNNLLNKTISLVDDLSMTEKLKGLVNYDLDACSASLNIYAISITEKIRLLDLSLKNPKMENLWDDLLTDFIDFGLDNFKKYPDQMFFEIDCTTGHFNIDFKQDIFHEDYSSLNESLLFDYHITGKVPNNDFIRKELNKALIFHDEETV